MTRALQVIVIRKNLLGSRHIARCPFQIDSVGSKIDVDVQPVFEYMQVLVPGAEQRFNVRSNLDAFLHARRFITPCENNPFRTRLQVDETQDFAVRLDLAGMLAPKVQATTIDSSLPRSHKRV